MDAPTVALFSPTAAQRAILDRVERFSVIVCHRGFGKTFLGVAALFRIAIDSRQSVRVAYITDTRIHAEDMAWKPLVEPRIEVLQAAGVRVNRQDLSLAFPNGTLMGFYGTKEDNERVRGLHLDYAVFDEFALVPPAVWELVVFPALLRRHGGAMFMGTPMGRNHFHGLYKAHERDAEWMCTTVRASDSGVLTPEQLAIAQSIQTPEQYAQEYECSWDTPMRGAVYARELLAARAAQRIRVIGHDPSLETETWWDLGARDATAIVFTQTLDREIRIVDYLEDDRKDLAFYAKALRDRPYLYARHHLPHDAGSERLEGGLKSIERQLNELGLRQTTVHPRQDVITGVQQARLRFARCWFDEVRAARLLEALEAYHYEWDTKRNVAKDEPDHDWASHGADAFRLMCTHHRVARTEPTQTKARLMTDKFDYWRNRTPAATAVRSTRTVW